MLAFKILFLMSIANQGKNQDKLLAGLTGLNPLGTFSVEAGRYLNQVTVLSLLPPPRVWTISRRWGQVSSCLSSLAAPCRGREQVTSPSRP